MWTGPVFKILADKAGSIYPSPLLVGAISKKFIFLPTSQDIIRDHQKLIIGLLGAICYEIRFIGT